MKLCTIVQFGPLNILINGAITSQHLVVAVAAISFSAITELYILHHILNHHDNTEAVMTTHIL